MRSFLAQPGFLLARIDQICTSLYAELAAGETIAQAELLLLIEALGAAPQAALARGAGIDTSTAALVLANLEARAWIARSADPHDRRRAVTVLAADGKERIGRIGADYAELQARLLAPLAAGEAERLTAILAALVTNPDAPAPPYVPTAPVLDAAPGFLCRRAMQLFQGQFVASMGALNLTPRQYSLLFILTLVPSLTQVGFARLFGLDPSTCGVIMRNLDKRGLLESAPSAGDRRARDYRLTAAGRAVAAEAGPAAEQSSRRVLAGLPAADINWLVARLRALVAAHSERLRFPGALDSSA